MTPDTDKREWLGEWIYAKFVQNYEKLLEENKKLKLENAKLKDRIITDENFEEKLDKENKKLKVELELKNLALKQAQEWSILI